MENKPFKRINFFPGFVTTADDWNAAEDYHNEKRKLHNRCLHTPGIVRGYLKNLDVNASKDGSSLYIGTGCAIDDQGREIHLSEPEPKSLDLQRFKSASTVYVILCLKEESIDRRTNPANGEEYSGNAFIKEFAEVEITDEHPDENASGIVEIARIKIGKKFQRVKDPADPANPLDNEIDRTHVKWAGAIMRPLTLEDVAQLVTDKDDFVTVPVSKIPTISDDDTQIPIERVNPNEAFRSYIVSAYPVEDQAKITWTIVTELRKGVVDYRLYFKNFGSKSAKVNYRVYRIGA